MGYIGFERQVMTMDYLLYEPLTYDQFKYIVNQYGVSTETTFGTLMLNMQDLSQPLGGEIEIAAVSTKHQYEFEVEGLDDTLLKPEDWEYLAYLCMRLSATPIDQRGELKSSYRHKLMAALKH